MRYEVSIDEPLNVDWDGNELLLSDILGTEPDIVAKPLEEETDKQILRDAVVQLPPRDKHIMSFGSAYRLGRSARKSRWRTSWASLNRISPGWKNAFFRA